MRSEILLVAALAAGACSTGTPGEPSGTDDPRDASAGRVPDGFELTVFAEGVPAPRMIAFGPDGRLYAALSDAGRVVRFDLAADGSAAGGPEVVADGLRRPYGLAFRDGALWIGETHRVIRLSGSGFEDRQVVVPDLPTGGHWTREIAFGPDGLLYVSVGSSCNVCVESDPRRAAVVRYRSDGSAEEIVARGVRNSAGLAFHPGTGELWMSQNERDFLGDDLPPEEINILDPADPGADYGWPYCYGAGVPNPEFDDPDRCEGTVAPALTMQAHSAPLGMAFYTADDFPPEYRGDLFLAFHGSWNRSERTGYEVVRVRVRDGRPVGWEPFATGWLREDGSVTGRPVAVAVGPDGTLYVSDDGADRIWRVRWTG